MRAHRRVPWRPGRAIMAAAAVALGVSTAFVTAGEAHAATGCEVDYSVNDWGSGFTANVSITNLGDPLTSWTMEWDYSGDQQVTQGWSADISQSGKHVTATNLSYNGSLATNGSTSFGFNGSYSGTNNAPTSFSLNGIACTGETGDDGGDDGDDGDDNPPQNGDHVDNPFVGGEGYVNPEWAEEARNDGGAAIADQPTAVWLDRIAAIQGVDDGMGLRDHLDAALDQGADYAEFVIYDLPGRDCAALASNGELGPEEIGRYENDYIDPIASIMDDEKYADLKIIAIIEPDSLPNLVTNTGGSETETEMCNTMKANGNYVEGVQYALNELHAIPNVYNYVDMAHHGWLGWEDNFDAAAQMFADVVGDTDAGFDSVDGFISNTANYSVLEEPYFEVNSRTRQSDWVDWNQYVGELPFTQDFRQELISEGFPSDIGMLIDTSRNGWGGPDRPTGPSSASDVDTYVNESRTDRRPHVGDWCNQTGAGIGERPTAAPESGIDAYIWAKPPGESDGASEAIPNDEGKGFDRMCDPTYEGNPRNNNHPTGALPDAPLSGHWFSAQFHQLLANAYPPIQ